MWPRDLIWQFLDVGTVFASRKPRGWGSGLVLEGFLGWTWGCYLQVRSRGWSSAGPEAGAPICGTRGRCLQSGLVTAGPEGGPEGARRSYLASRARLARGPRHAARPSAGHTPPRPRRAPVAGPAHPRRPPWPLARSARHAPLALLAAAAAAGPRNRGEITPPNDCPAPGAAAAPAAASPGRASQPIGARAGAAPANQRPPSRSQPRRAGGRATAGRSWARKRISAGRPAPPGRPGPVSLPETRAGTAHHGLGRWACAVGRSRAPPRPETGLFSARTAKRLLCARSASGGRRAGGREPSLGGLFE